MEDHESASTMSPIDADVELTSFEWTESRGS